MKKLILTSLVNVFKNFNLNKKKLNYDTELDLEINCEDITSATISDDNNIISRAVKRNGIPAKITSCSIILDNGNVYVPKQLSDHWRAYTNSPKIKPFTIKYIKL